MKSPILLRAFALVIAFSIAFFTVRGFAQEAPTLPFSLPADAPAQEDTAEIETRTHRLTLRAGALNRISFASAFTRVVLSPDAPLASEPSKLPGNRTMIIEVRPNAKGSFQAIAQLVDGSLVEIEFTVSTDAPPLSWTQPAPHPFGEPTAEARMPVQRPSDANFQSIFEALVQGEVPDGYAEVPPPAGGQIGDLRAQYLAAFRGQDYVVLVARLSGKRSSWIAEQDLYVPGVKAVLLDGQRIGEDPAPVAYLVMAVEH